jgi:hypothetical protein
VFNPQEEKLLQECKLKFQVNIFQYKRLPNVKAKDASFRLRFYYFRPFIIADVMLYNIEIAQAFSAENTIKQELFYRACSTLSSTIVYMMEMVSSMNLRLGLMLFIRKQSCKTGKRAKLQRNHREI